ncbi:hypothetical protein GGR50DRAFT_689800 [Xylaria sp. CBS 124048]|nr:hypothetical protein GGR50DRAFT_689800 [Xylaria sp. CBS 124048]
MDLSPPSLIRSPSSSCHSSYSSYSRSPSLGLEYSTSDLDGSFYKVDSVYDQTYIMDSGSSHDHLNTASAEWEEATVIHPSHSILPPEYVSYANYEPAMQAAPFSHDLYSTPHLAHAPTLASMSSRSPEPNYSAAVARHPLPYHGSASPMPRIKLEGGHGHDYSSGGELSQYPSPQSSSHALMTEPGSYSSRAGSSGYLSDAPSGSWAATKSDYGGLEAESSSYYANSSASSLERTRGLSSSATSVPINTNTRISSSSSPSSSSRPPKRPARRLTSKEEANFQCEVEGCGKLFSRSYNYKAHLETHDKKREYPFPCTFEDCSKRFVRKTDLQRHHQSVHMKEKNHKCDYCGRLFARKDTLRRHMEDGCSKRFDIGTMDLRGVEAYDTYPIPGRPVPSSGHLLPPLALPRGVGDNGMINMPPFMKR